MPDDWATRSCAEWLDLLQLERGDWTMLEWVDALSHGARAARRLGIRRTPRLLLNPVWRPGRSPVGRYIGVVAACLGRSVGSSWLSFGCRALVMEMTVAGVC